MANFIKVKFDKFMLPDGSDVDKAEFFCPHCDALIVTWIDQLASAPVPLPNKCPSCSGAIDNTGVSPYITKSGGSSSGSSGTGGMGGDINQESGFDRT